ncbi:DUF262 domain-containing protein [Halorubrum halodurans]|uniref:DUF262 domain-containing protein n=1 Tax=Halorubrum halodurans TaxID=1383851 RepID=A0A256IGK0_9EURY|nr:DUF262 domain-containing protein [Halorubrum halodurans]OYR55664.1 hypothetical protein DJ70_11180 [Halorubrum halodurans]
MANGIGLSATEDTVEQVLTRNYRYTVPDYQRRYSWGEEQWGALWADLNSIRPDSTHFLGSVVLIERSSGLNELNKLEIVDGQQRIATITVLLSLMREKYYELGESEQAEDIENKYLKKQDLDRNEYQNLTLSTFDNPDLEKVIERKYGKMDDGQLREAVQFYASKLDDLDVDELDKLRKRLLASVTLVSIRCEGEQSAFRLFETLNDRGMELSSVDLMKNYTFSKAASAPDSEIDYEQVQDDWERLIKTLMPNMSQPSRFFRHYIMSASEPNYDGDVSDYKLYDEFQKIVDSKLPDAGIALNEYVTELADKAELYAKILNHEIDMYDDAGNKAINSKLNDLEIINSVQARTLMLRVFEEYNTANKVMESLLLLESFLMRWKVSSYPTGGELDRIYSRICSEAFEKENSIREIYSGLSDRCPSDEEFIASIENKRVRLNDRTSYILKRLEMDYYNGTELDLDKLDREHIAPRASFTAKKYSAWPSTLGTTEAQFEQFRDKLGNLTLLETDKNISIGADPFEKKQEAYAESKLQMNQQLCEDYDNWGTDEIDQRTSELANAMVQIWNLDA